MLLAYLCITSAYPINIGISWSVTSLVFVSSMCTATLDPLFPSENKSNKNA